MNVKQIGSNMTEVTMDGARVLFSYETPVAAYVDGEAVKTDRKWSVTTSKHIRKYLGNDCDTARVIPQAAFATLHIRAELGGE